MKRITTILIIAFLATSFAATGFSIATTPALLNISTSTSPTNGFTSNLLVHQGITGKAVISNTAPLCTISGSQPATGPNLVVTSSSRSALVVSLNWSLVNNCALVAQLTVPLKPGSYSVTLSPCSYLGCRVLPLSVVVEPGGFTPVNINIVTGIV